MSDGTDLRSYFNHRVSEICSECFESSFPSIELNRFIQKSLMLLLILIVGPLPRDQESSSR